MVICGQIFSPGVISAIQQYIDGDPSRTRENIARWVCAYLDWVDDAKRPKVASAKKALLDLHRTGALILPDPSRAAPSISSAVPIDFVLPEVAGDLRNHPRLRLDIVKSKEDRQLWLHLIRNHHYLGEWRVIGPQIKYLIRSDDMVLGALCFSSAAWSVRPRDEWIGWNSSERQRGLKYILSNTRFLILPTVRVNNLASKVLSMAVRRIAKDWKDLYKVKPLLIETFIDQAYHGGCYRAANWIDLGDTTGRGRNDQLEGEESRKRILIYPLAKKMTILYGQTAKTPTLNTESAGRPVKALIQGPVQQGADWAENEFGTADLGDPRLNRRLVDLGRDIGARPHAKLTETCGGSMAKYRGACRFFNNSSVTLNKILQPHQEATLRRCRNETIVLAAQDTTTLNYASHQKSKGFGPIAAEHTGAVGLMVHDTLLINKEGTPLGLLDVQCWARDESGSKAKSEDSESDKWFHSYAKLCEAQKLLPDTRFISVGDREADIYSLFEVAQSDENNPDLIVRARTDRSVDDNASHLWEKMDTQPVKKTFRVKVARKKGDIPKREAIVEVRACEVEIMPPGYNKKGDKGLWVWAVYAKEICPPDGIEGLEWMLLTTCVVDTSEMAEAILRYYGHRWQIEVYHRTLKTGCDIENRMFPQRESIEACLAIDLVVAWRVFYLVRLGRETPEVSCEIFFEECEWKALYIRTKFDHPPRDPISLGVALKLVASLGGYIEKKSSPPGNEVVWRGMETLESCVFMYLAMTGLHRPYDKSYESFRLPCVG